MVDMETHLKDLCARIAPDINKRTYQGKKDVYTYLDLTIIATPEGADIKGFLDPSVIKTSSCLPMAIQSSPCSHRYYSISVYNKICPI